MAGSFHSRETRDFARETKFLVSAGTIEDVKAWARANLGADPHGTGEFGDHYATTSLYFDTANHDVYHRNSSHARGKFRIRRYGLLDFIFLERKFRTDRLLAKRRTTVPVEELQKLAADEPDPTWKGYWFHRRVLMRGLQPKIQMSYHRIARVTQTPTGLLRVTFDTNLRVLPMPDRAFLPGVGLPLLEDKIIIEVKYRVELPPMIKLMAETFGLQIERVSKYRLGLGALDYAPPPEEERAS
jgi:VTC domain